DFNLFWTPSIIGTNFWNFARAMDLAYDNENALQQCIGAIQILLFIFKGKLNCAYTDVAGNAQIDMENRQVSVTLPTDNNGYLGRTCPQCKEYFKIKLGTGLKNIKTCICPYCGHKTQSSEFTTAEQYEYAKSVAIGQVKTELLGQIYKQVKGLEFGRKGDFIH
ncbi:MAG: hypothetical protein ACHQ1D_08335, partial [Nitrososphaerales archaeon]